MRRQSCDWTGEVLLISAARVAIMNQLASPRVDFHQSAERSALDLIDFPFNRTVNWIQAAGGFGEEKEEEEEEEEKEEEEEEEEKEEEEERAEGGVKIQPKYEFVIDPIRVITVKATTTTSIERYRRWRRRHSHLATINGLHASTI